MLDDTTPAAMPPSWQTEDVLKRLEAKTPPGQSVSVQVFLKDGVAPEQLSEVARQIVDDAAKSAGGVSSQPAEIGKVYRRAKSFSVRTAPSVVRQITGHDQVKAILPSEIEEGLLIKPVKKEPVP
jgi:hypothetical protein